MTPPPTAAPHAVDASLVLYAESEWDSPYVFGVVVALEEKRLPYTVRVLDLARGQQHEPPFRDRSLTGRVPALEHGDFMLTESLAILEYLEEVFAPPAHAALFPSETRARARARQVLGWLRSDLGPLREDRPTTTMFYARAHKPLSEAAQRSAEKLFRIALSLLPDGEEHLFGHFTLADAELSFMLHRLLLNGDPVPPRLARFAEAQWRRPSVRAYLDQPRPPHPDR